jgi:hypothetical protein
MVRQLKPKTKLIKLLLKAFKFIIFIKQHCHRITDKKYKIKCLNFQILEDTCLATSDVILLQSLQLSDFILWDSVKTTTSSTSTFTLMDLPSKTDSNYSSVDFGVDILIGEKEKFGQSIPTMASANSVSSKDETPSKRDAHLPFEPANATEKTGFEFSSVLRTGSATQSRTVVRSEMVVVGTGNDKVLFSQGLEIGSIATENVTFVGPETLKVTDRSDISLQKEKKDSLDTDYSTCYKGVCNVLKF